jgi:hypothetical protein
LLLVLLSLSVLLSLLVQLLSLVPPLLLLRLPLVPLSSLPHLRSLSTNTPPEPS